MPALGVKRTLFASDDFAYQLYIASIRDGGAYGAAGSTKLRVLRQGSASGRVDSPHLFLRMHILPDCAENILQNVCPNCGGGFAPRPISPATEWHPGLSLQASTLNSQSPLVLQS